MNKTQPVNGVFIMRFLLCALLFSLAINPVTANQDRESKQANLDGACEVERQKKLAPLRKKIVDECTANKELSSRDECVRFYADYGNRTGRRAPLFYDLPECVTAFEYNQSSRASD